MRRLASQLGVSLLALLLSGWGGALAATLCPHAGMSRSHLATEEVEDHACCLAKLERAEVEQADAHHKGEHGAKAQPDCHAGSARQALSFVQPVGSCNHCAGRNESPTRTTGARELTSQKRDAGKLPAYRATTPFSLPAVFAQQFVPTQHAPPGHFGRTHLLLGILLI